jgi:hypothetical protein
MAVTAKSRLAKEIVKLQLECFNLDVAGSEMYIEGFEGDDEIIKEPCPELFSRPAWLMGSPHAQEVMLNLFSDIALHLELEAKDFSYSEEVHAITYADGRGYFPEDNVNLGDQFKALSIRSFLDGLEKALVERLKEVFPKSEGNLEHTHFHLDTFTGEDFLGVERGSLTVKEMKAMKAELVVRKEELEAKYHAKPK